MLRDKKIFMAQSMSESKENLFLLPKMANRHGLIAGATGTGKTITMKVMAESFSDLGVPVFFSDVKGDLSGMCIPGEDNEGMQKRIAKFDLYDFNYRPYPTRFWDVFGEKGHPVRITVSDIGPILLARLLGLTDVQEGVLNIVFKVADDQGLLLLDLKDLRAMLQFVGDNRDEYTTMYGNVTTASIGAIQRALLKFEDEGGTIMFGEPALDIRDWMRTDIDGRGYINILSSTRLIQSPTVYGTFLLWMLTELFEVLPEVGDLEKPRMVFFFDEAHLLFDDAPKALVSKIVQVVKLIRSKGVGVYFVTQSPSDIPDDVLAQLSNRVQHALRAYTPAELKAVRAAAQAFRANPEFKTEDKIMELGVGEALVSFLDENGTPTVVEAAKILPPQSYMGACGDDKLNSVILSDEFELKYRESVDRESAYEIIMKATEVLRQQQEQAAADEEAEKAELEAQKQKEKEEAAAQKQKEKEEAAAQKQREKEEAAALKQKEKEEREAQKAQEKAEREAQKAQEKAEREAQKLKEKEEKAAAKEAERKKAATTNTIKKAVTSATSSVARSVSTNAVNTILGGTQTSGKTIAKRAATNAISSVMRSGVTAITRGLFGTKN